MSRPYLEVNGLKKSYGLKPVLRDVNLTLQQGERMALLGVNGAGKTTLLRILAGLIPPSAGTARIEGLDCVRHAQQVRALVGFVAHQPYLYEELSAWENLLFFGRMYNVVHVQERGRQLLQQVGLEKRMHERVATLSRGQVQRLAWARALLHSPRLLLLDEPETGLDTEGSELIRILWKKHTEGGGTTLFTTHQLERALELSDCVAMLSGGRIVYQQQTKLVGGDLLQYPSREKNTV
jgi:heme ABC exporter ATP-binding subunit CcmA